MAKQQRVVAKAPARAKILAHLSHVSAEERARMGITDEMVREQLEKQKPPKGVHVVRSQWQPTATDDLEDQVRVIDYDQNKVLFSGTPAEYKRLMGAKEA